MQSVERTITVDTPLATVWPYVADFTNTEEWDPPTKTTGRRSGDGGVGTVYENTSSMLGSDVEVTYTVTEFEPRRRLQLRGETSSFELLDTLTFEGGDTGTTLTYHAEFRPRGAARLTEPLLPLGLERLADKTEDRLDAKLRQLGTGPAVDAASPSP